MSVSRWLDSYGTSIQWTIIYHEIKIHKYIWINPKCIFLHKSSQSEKVIHAIVQAIYQSGKVRIMEIIK
jgi:hypothetical protein